MSILGSNPSPKKIYPGSVDEDSKQYFDMKQNNTEIYGGFSVGPESGEGDGTNSEVISPPPLVNIANLQNTIAVNVNSTMNDFIQKDVDQLIGGEF